MTAPETAAARRSALACGAIVFAVCLAVIHGTPRDGYWIADCGNKALLAKQLLASGFRSLELENPAPHLDPAGVGYPIREPFAVTLAGRRVSQYPPAYSAVAVPFLAVLGPPGLRWPAALGAALCAGLFVLWLAPCVGARWASVGGLTLALATPLFFYGVTVWEHSLTVALSLAAWLLLRNPVPWCRFASGLLLGLSCWFREELALMAAAVAMAAVLGTRRLGVHLPLLAGIALPIAALGAFNAAVYANPLGPHLAPNVGGTGSDVVGGDWIGPGRALLSLLGGVGANVVESGLLGGAALVAVGLGWFAGRGESIPTPALGAVALLAIGSWLVGLAHLLPADRPLSELVRYNGLIVQLPLVGLAGLGLRRVWGRAEFAEVRVGVAAGLFFLVLSVLAGIVSRQGSQSGFGVHWGPRLLLPAAPALVALAIAALRSAGRGAARWSVMFIGAGLVSSAIAVWLLHEQKTEAQRLHDAILARPEPVALTSHPLLAQHLAELWGRKPILFASDAASLRRLGRMLDARGVGEFLWLTPSGSAIPAGRDGPRCRRIAQQRGTRLRYLDMDLQACRSGS